MSLFSYLLLPHKSNLVMNTLKQELDTPHLGISELHVIEKWCFMPSIIEMEEMKQLNFLLIRVLRRVRVINMIRESILVNCVKCVSDK